MHALHIGLETLSNFQLLSLTLRTIERHTEVIGLGNAKSNWDGMDVRSPAVVEVCAGVAYRWHERRRHPRQNTDRSERESTKRQSAGQHRWEGL